MGVEAGGQRSDSGVSSFFSLICHLSSPTARPFLCTSPKIHARFYQRNGNEANSIHCSSFMSCDHSVWRCRVELKVYTQKRHIGSLFIICVIRRREGTDTETAQSNIKGERTINSMIICLKLNCFGWEWGNPSDKWYQVPEKKTGSILNDSVFSQ